MTPKTALIVGVGGFGELWADALSAQGIAIAAGVDPSNEALNKFARVHGLSEQDIAPELEAWNGSADIVIDSAPPFERTPRLIWAAEFAKLIVTAKPLVTSLEDLDTLEKSLGPKTSLIRVAMQKRMLPAFLAMRDFLKSGEIGTPTYIRSLVELDGTFWRPGYEWRRDMRMPSLWEGAVHQIDLILNWLPNFVVDAISAMAWHPQGASFHGACDFDAIVRSKSGTIAHIISRWSVTTGPVTHYFSGIRVDGERGSAEVRDGKLYINDELHTCPEDGETLMDIAALNKKLAPQLFDLSERRSDLGLDQHKKVLEIVSLIEKSALANGVSATLS